MINDNNNNNNNKSLRSTTAILHLLRARWEILFSLGYLPTSIYLYIHIVTTTTTTTRYKKWGSDSKYPKRVIESAK